MDPSELLVIGDLIGVAVFAASGASAGVAKRLDMFGVVFVGFVAALGGGIFRDLVIDTAPLAFTDWRYPVTAAVASLLTFRFHPQLDKLRKSVLLLDAAGLALFTVTGTLKGLHAPLPAVGACLIGMLSAIGGGLGRDLLTAEIPAVLRHEIYALAALIGAVAVAGLVWLNLDSLPTLVGAAVIVFAIRVVALRRKWSAPVPRVG
ncbi:putative membrane protein YeiH [Allocatelliglobosispora scoriae]|uniref:Putative membrane protein YeiH n=1 Tax=Allocatelliglobosispora scoriae TaxID=643052 RepID=A0A841BW63_9ACTN|nr:TRIC cation channel family protein [Allocatelliglobosispora scoriae]MBB5872394.1 putative membrane protein YeiH [Allocatelliglobosispora scoriae]